MEGESPTEAPESGKPGRKPRKPPNKYDRELAAARQQRRRERVAAARRASEAAAAEVDPLAGYHAATALFAQLPTHAQEAAVAAIPEEDWQLQGQIQQQPMAAPAAVGLALPGAGGVPVPLAGPALPALAIEEAAALGLLGLHPHHSPRPSPRASIPPASLASLRQAAAHQEPLQQVPQNGPSPSSSPPPKRPRKARGQSAKLAAAASRAATSALLGLGSPPGTQAQPTPQQHQYSQRTPAANENTQPSGTERLTALRPPPPPELSQRRLQEIAKDVKDSHLTATRAGHGGAACKGGHFHPHTQAQVVQQLLGSLPFEEQQWVCHHSAPATVERLIADGAQRAIQTIRQGAGGGAGSLPHDASQAANIIVSAVVSEEAKAHRMVSAVAQRLGVSRQWGARAVRNREQLRLLALQPFSFRKPAKQRIANHWREKVKAFWENHTRVSTSTKHQGTRKQGHARQWLECTVVSCLLSGDSCWRGALDGKSVVVCPAWECLPCSNGRAAAPTTLKLIKCGCLVPKLPGCSPPAVLGSPCNLNCTFSS